jgi:hypothetical protein
VHFGVVQKEITFCDEMCAFKKIVLFRVNVATSIMITKPLDEKGTFDIFIFMNF